MWLSFQLTHCSAVWYYHFYKGDYKEGLRKAKRAKAAEGRKDYYALLQVPTWLYQYKSLLHCSIVIFEASGFIGIIQQHEMNVYQTICTSGGQDCFFGGDQESLQKGGGEKVYPMFIRRVRVGLNSMQDLRFATTLTSTTTPARRRKPSTRESSKILRRPSLFLVTQN